MPGTDNVWLHRRSVTHSKSSRHSEPHLPLLCASSLRRATKIVSSRVTYASQTLGQPFSICSGYLFPVLRAWLSVLEVLCLLGWYATQTTGGLPEASEKVKRASYLPLIGCAPRCSVVRVGVLLKTHNIYIRQINTSELLLL